MDLAGLSTICAGLGYIPEDENGVRIGYSKGEFCLDNLKDLQRFLRRDDPQTRDVFKQVCKWSTVSRHLIPIIESYQNDRDFVINAVKVLVFLTMPIDPTSDDIPQQIEFLWRLKAAVTRNDTIAVIVSLLEDPLEHLECEVFTEDDWKLVQLVLTLFRNLLTIQDITLQQKASGSATQFLCLRDKFLELLFSENVMELILVLAQHVGGSQGYLRQDNLLLLETFHYVFLGHEPELIAKASRKGYKVDGDIKTSLNSLGSFAEDEEKQRLIRARNLDRYSQFSGSFTRIAMDGSKTLLKGNLVTASGGGLLKAHKVQRGPLKRIAWDHGSLYSPNENVLELLHDFLNQFLSGGYNVLMQSIRKDIEKEHHAIQRTDVIVFFQVAHFVTAFQHIKFSISKPKMGISRSEESSINQNADGTLFHGDICGPIAATMNETMFAIVTSKWRNAFDGLKETNDYKFLSAAGALMKDMIRMLDLVLKVLPEDSKEPQTARILLYKIFYDQTDQGMTQFLVNLIKSFDTHKQPKSDLADLVEMIHIVLRLMENLQACGTLRVAKKSRKGKKKKLIGDGIATEVEIQGEADGSVQNIKDPGHEFDDANAKQAVELNDALHRQVTNSGSDGKEENNSAPNQISEPEMPLLDTDNLGDNLGQIDKEKVSNSLNDMAYGTDSSNDGQEATRNEVDFNISKLVGTFANNTIIQKLCWLLRFYKSNTASTNHYIIRMLQRICNDLELSPMLYQLSLLATFYDILNDPKSSNCKEYANIVSFLTKLVRKLLKKMKTQPLLFVEILFWKTRHECHYINSESLLSELGNLKKQSRHWGIVSGSNGDIGSSKGNGGLAGRSIADSLGEDEADFVISPELNHQMEEDSSDGNLKELLHKPKGRKLKKSGASISDNEIAGEKFFGLNDHDNEGDLLDHEPQKASKRKHSTVFDQEQETNIKNLYEKYKDNRHCSRLIAETLDPDGKITPVQVSCKLKQLGLKVSSKKKMLPVDGPHSGGDNQIEASNKLEDGSFLKSPYHNKKRVRAFSKEQELVLKDLFEQFKNHKRCSHMIANALDADNVYSAAQVSHKLKQLGLCVPRQRRQPKATKHSGDDDLDNLVGAEREERSDEETLLAIKKRVPGQRKKPQTTKHSGDDDLNNLFGAEREERSDEETLSAIKKRKNGKQKIEATKWQKDDSDDEILSNILKKSRRGILSEAKDDILKSGSARETVIGNELTTPASQNVVESEEHPQHDGIEPSRTLDSQAEGLADLDGNVEVALANISGGERAEFSVEDSVGLVGNIDHLPHQQSYDELADELADSDDEVGPVALKNVQSRRKFRVSFDLEDDD
ncbi:timeless family protein isoform X2 [Tasmannia lanceolata]|uniref:timeless family protein isoform X2 n=1 Tax=Tasmannia lanceolata TaxID=3420 RepID=UPI004062BCEB